MISGCNAGTPLHHAAKRDLENTVKLLLSHGGKFFKSLSCQFSDRKVLLAVYLWCFIYIYIMVFLLAANPLALNDDFQTPLDVARDNGHSDVVRAIEVC